MILTTKGRYAINAVMEMSENSDNKPMNLATIAEKQNISVSYLEQIFSNLKNADLVESIKGPGGGYVLKHSEITAHDIIKATGEKIQMTSCANEDNCVKIEENNHKCKTHHVWKGLERTIESYFKSVLIKNIAQTIPVKGVIYFDNNSTTKIDPKVLNLMNETYQKPLNSSSQHQFGQIAAKYVNAAKDKISNLLNAQNYQIIFNSGATEANNTALQAFENYQIITSAIEHISVLDLAKKQNATIIGVDAQGLLNLAELEKTLQNLEHKNFLVSVIFANNETGVIQNLKEIARLTHQYGGLIHSDITQAAGKIKVDLEDLNIDLASISAHKINGPQGVGALLVRNSLQINPLILGGLQEEGKRAGTTNIAGIAGFGEACKIDEERLAKYQETANLRDYLENKLTEKAANNVEFFSKTANRLPNTSFFATKNLSNQTLLIALDLNKIAVSIGAACSSGVSKTSPVLKALGVDEKTASCAIRISLGAENTKEEIDKFIAIWEKLYSNNN